MKVDQSSFLVSVAFHRSSLVMVRVTGGEAPGGSSLAPKIGPLGLVNTSHFIEYKNTILLCCLVSKESG